MTTYHVYQPALTEKQSRDVNRNGWAGYEAYLKTSMMGPDNAAERVEGAISYYQHQWIVEADDPEQAFEILNLHHDRAIWKSDHACSMSVGAVLMDAFGNNGVVCCSFGFSPLSAAECRVFQSAVTTVVPTAPNS